jgi:pyruvate/2-oxoglutarate dehydrogenase complex dihydrolipoamide dehydrogenase (E3) component
MLTYDLALQVAGRTPQWQEDYRRQGWRINARVIPSVAYTDPEVAWVSLTEDETKGIEMGADAVDICKTIHPHPTLGESIGMAVVRICRRQRNRPFGIKMGWLN